MSVEAYSAFLRTKALFLGLAVTSSLPNDCYPLSAGNSAARPSPQRQVDALKRLQAETAADPPSSDFSATRLDALLPAILDSAIKGEL